MKNVVKTLAVVALGAMLAACEKDNPTDNGLTDNQKKMAATVENYVPNVVYNTYKALADESDKLYQALNSASQKAPDRLIMWTSTRTGQSRMPKYRRPCWPC